MIGTRHNDIEQPLPEEADPVLLEEMAKAGMLYGSKKSKTHPRMQRYIFATRNGMQVLDLVQTAALIERAGAFLEKLSRRGSKVLIVGTLPGARDLVRILGERLGLPYVTERWLGGTLTNFSTISSRVKHYLKLKADRDAGKLAKYTKKERLEFDREIERMETMFSGIASMEELPQALLVVGVADHRIAIHEAQRVRIPTVAIISSNADPDLIDYPIPANDKAKPSIAWVLDRLAGYIESGRQQAIAAQATAVASQQSAGEHAQGSNKAVSQENTSTGSNRAVA